MKHTPSVLDMLVGVAVTVGCGIYYLVLCIIGLGAAVSRAIGRVI